MVGLVVRNASLGQIRQNSAGLLGSLTGGSTDVLGADDVKGLVGLPTSLPSSVGSVLQSTNLQGSLAWSPSPGALLPSLLPASGTLMSYGGDRQLVAGGTVSHAGNLVMTGAANGIYLNPNGVNKGLIYFSGGQNRLNGSSLVPWVVESDAGFRVRNTANSADAPVTCGAITASGTVSIGTNARLLSTGTEFVTQISGGNSFSVRSDAASVNASSRIGFTNTSNAHDLLDAYFVRNSASSIGVKGLAGIDGALTAGAITASGNITASSEINVGSGSNRKIINAIISGRGCVYANELKITDGAGDVGSTGTINTLQSSAGVLTTSAGFSCGAITSSTLQTSSGPLTLGPWNGIVSQSNQTTSWGSGVGGFVCDNTRGFLFAQYANNTTNGTDAGIYRDSAPNALRVSATHGGTPGNLVVSGIGASTTTSRISFPSAAQINYDTAAGGGSATHFFRENGVSYLQVAGGNGEIQGTRAYTFGMASAAAPSLAMYLTDANTLEVNNRTGGQLRDLAVRHLRLGNTNNGWTSAGTNGAYFHAGVIGTAGRSIYLGPRIAQMSSDGRFTFSSTVDSGSTADASIGRESVGVVGVYTTALGGTKAGFVCGSLISDGWIQETPRQSSLAPTATDIPTGKRQGWYNSTLSEFRDYVNIGGTLLKSAAYT